MTDLLSAAKRLDKQVRFTSVRGEAYLSDHPRKESSRALKAFSKATRAASRGVTPWIAPRPISEAPKDRRVLAWCSRWKTWMVVRWFGDHWFSASVGERTEPTHFYDLPEDMP